MTEQVAENKVGPPRLSHRSATHEDALRIEQYCVKNKSSALLELIRKSIN